MKRLIVALLLWPSIAFADTSVLVQGGLLTTQNSNYGESVSTVIRAEKNVVPQINGALEAGYHGPTSHYPEFRDKNAYGDMSGFHLMAGPIFYPDVSWALKPYILGLWGYSWWDFDRSQEVKDLGINIDLGSSFCQKYGIGADYKINDNWSANIEFNYFQSHVPKDSGDSIILTDEKTIGQEELSFIFGLRYRW